MNMVMEAEEVTVVVYHATGLQGRKKDRHKYSVIFGLGAKKFRTQIVKEDSGSPIWNEESIIPVHDQNSVLKFVVTEKEDVLGMVTVGLSELTTGRNRRKFDLQPHKKCLHPVSGSCLTFDAWVSAQREAVAADTNTGSHNPFKQLKKSISKSPMLGRKFSEHGGKSPKLSRRGSDAQTQFYQPSPDLNKQRTESLRETPEEKGNLTKRYAHSMADLTALPSSNSSSSRQRSSNPFEEQQQQPSPRSSGLRAFGDGFDVDNDSLTDLAGSDSSSLTKGSDTPGLSRGSAFCSKSVWDLTGEVSNSPEITGVSPKEASIDGGSKIVIRGINLGAAKEDVVGLFVCGANLLGSLEYESSSKLVCYTKKWKVITGHIVVETQSGGRATSLVEFRYFDPNPPSPAALTPTPPPRYRSPLVGRKVLNVDSSRLSTHSDDSAESATPKESDRKGGFLAILSGDKKDGDTTPTKSKKKTEIRIAELEEKLKSLENENSDLRDQNKEMKSYIERLLMKAMLEAPQLLCKDGGLPPTSMTKLT